MSVLGLVLAFVLGVVLTWAWCVRTVHREVPADALRRLWQVDPDTGEPSEPAAERARATVAGAQGRDLDDQPADEHHGTHDDSRQDDPRHSA